MAKYKDTWQICYTSVDSHASYDNFISISDHQSRWPLRSLQSDLKLAGQQSSEGPHII